MPLLIAGYKGAGKDGFYKLISSRDSKYNIYLKNGSDGLAISRILSSSPPRMAFADLLKEIISEKIGISLETLERNKRIDPTIRQAMIEQAALLKRTKGENYFSEYVIRNSSWNTIVTDLRFKVELEGWDKPIYTARVIREGVEVSESDHTERELDYLETDIIITPIEEKRVFNGYTLTDSI